LARNNSCNLNNNFSHNFAKLSLNGAKFNKSNFLNNLFIRKQSSIVDIKIKNIYRFFVILIRLKENLSFNLIKYFTLLLNIINNYNISFCFKILNLIDKIKLLVKNKELSRITTIIKNNFFNYLKFFNISLLGIKLFYKKILILFYKKFLNDTNFRNSRIIFPIKGYNSDDENNSDDYFFDLVIIGLSAIRFLPSIVKISSFLQSAVSAKTVIQDINLILDKKDSTEKKDKFILRDQQGRKLASWGRNKAGAMVFR
jgi:hypothetical protein